jgi:hypothetical protein
MSTKDGKKIMPIGANRSRRSGGAMKTAAGTRRSDDRSVGETAERLAMEADERLLGAFPWARALPREERLRFADELAHHPSEMTNAQLEALLVGWREAADAARISRERRARLGRAA